ncbi:MAG: diacylglycerol/polyprenol kinase family protein [Treponemataceae bacterium]
MSHKRQSQKGILHQRYIRDLQKELFRKSIHISTLLVPLFALTSRNLVIILLVFLSLIYTCAEILRIKGHTIPFFTTITMAAARKRDENRFVLGPITLSMGVLLTIFFFEGVYASIGICALALGDGIASIVGKFLGRIRIPCLGGKTLEGSLACFVAVFLSTFLISKKAVFSFVIAGIAMFIEMIPLKDMDNFFIPLITAGFAQFFLNNSIF